MIDGTSTLERVATPPVKPAPSSGTAKRIAIIAVGLGFVAAIATSAVMVLGGQETNPTVGPTVTGDRDAAWLSSLERQAASTSETTGEQTGQYSPSRDKEEALKQAEARRAAQVTDKEEGLRQAEERRAALKR